MPADHKNRTLLSELAGELDHDLRTPITSIQGFAELMLDDDSITGESREYLTIIINESERMAAMLKKFSAAIEADDL